MSIASVKQSLMNGVAVVHRISCTAIEPRHGRGGTARQFLEIIMDSNGSAKNVWKEFEKMFQSVTNGRKLMLRQKLATLKMEPGEKAARYVARAKDLKRDLNQAGLDAKEVDLAAACGLSKDYREIMMMLEYQDKPIRLDEMLPLLLQHEARIEEDEKTGDAGQQQSTLAFSSRNFKPHHKKDFQKKSSDQGSTKQFDCYTCGKPGHRSSECMRNPHKDLKCNRCGRKGHIKADCRSKETSKKNEDQGGFQKTMIFTAGKTKELESCWLLDSGATHHLAWNRELFTKLEEFDEEVYVEGVSEELLKIEGIGCIDLVCETDGGTHQIRLEGVKFAPKAGVNLASLSKLLNKGAILHGEGRVLTLSKEGETFLQANNQNDLMVIQTANKPGPRAFVASEAEKAELWHRRFGHAGLDSLAKMAQEGLVEGMSVRAESFKKIKDEVCEPCVLEKQTRKSFPASKRESQGPMDLIHTDVCGPMQTKTPGGRCYFVSFTDDYSRSAVIQLLSNKNQVQDALEAFVNTMET
jgi:hypothetical protein